MSVFQDKIQREKLPQLWTEDKERAKSYIFKITSFAPEPEAIEKLKQIILRGVFLWYWFELDGLPDVLIWLKVYQNTS